MKPNLSRLVLYCWIFFTGAAFGQPREPRFRHYGTADGLSQGSVFSMWQDSHGFMWFGTLDGLNRFDGYNFKVFRPSYDDNTAIKGGRINSITEDNQGMLWIGTNEAINRYDFKTNRFTHFYLPDDNHHPIKGRYDPFFIDDKGELWFTYLYGYLASMNLVTGKFTKYPFADGAMDEFTTAAYPEKKFYRPLTKIYSAGRGGLSIIEPAVKKVRYYFSSRRENRAGNKTGIGRLLEDRSGLLWLASDSGLIAFNPAYEIINVYNRLPVGNKNLLLFGLAWDENQNLWCSSDGSGLLQFDTRSRIFKLQYLKNPGDTESLAGNSLTCLFADRDRNLWMCIDQAGIDKINPTYEQIGHMRINPVDKPQGYIGSVWSITETDADHTLICSDYKDLFIYEHGSGNLTRVNLPGAFRGAAVFCMMTDSRNRLWIATEEGLLYSDDRLKHAIIVKRQNWYDAVLFEYNERILIAANTQFFSVPMKGSADRIDTIHAFDGEEINSIATSPRGCLAITRADGTLFLSEQDNDNLRIVKKTIFDFQIKSVIFSGEDTVWLGTSVGLARYNVKTGVLKLFSEQNGLANNMVYCLLPDQQGHIWISTNRGISRFDPGTGDFNNFGLAEGAQSLEFNGHSCYRSASGMLYFGGVRGFNYFDPAKIKAVPFNPSLQLLNVMINGKPFLPNLFLNRAEPPKLQSDQNNISIEFAAIDFNRNRNIRYLYRLHASGAWLPAGNQRTLSFVNLPAGDYFLQVKAQYTNSLISNNILKASFHILQPFYHTVWFLALALLLLASLLYGIYRYRIGQFLKILSVRNTIARDLHDDVGSTLGSISIYTEVAARELGKKQDAQAQAILGKMGIASRELIERMSDIVWSIRTDNDHSGNLFHRMQDFASTMLTAREILVAYDVEEKAVKKVLSMQQRKNLYLIFKEAIYNLVKYAAAKQVTISLKTDNERLLILVRDDGKGFDLTEERFKRSNGLRNMRFRAAEIDARIDIRSAIGFGTVVELKMPW